MAIQHKNYNPDLMAGGADETSIAQTITAASSQALAVGANGATNPVLEIDSNTASVATGLKVTGAAAAGGLAVAVISSGTNENLTIDAKGSGTITIAGTSTGAVTITRAVTHSSTLTQTGAATFAGAIVSDATTDSTSGTTGAIQTDGGLGVAKAIFAGTKIVSVGPTSGIGYATGAGGTVTQLTNRSTGVTINKICGTIQTDTTSLAAGASAEFTVTNSAVAIGDVVVVSQQSGSSTVAGVAGTLILQVVTVAAGSFILSLNNNSSTTAETGAVIINFAVIKAVAA